MARLIIYNQDVFEIEEEYLKEAGIDLELKDKEIIEKLEEYEQQKRPN